MQPDDMKIFRNELDRIDSQVLDLIKKRFEIVSKIGRLKQLLKIQSLQEERRRKVLALWRERAVQLSIDPAFTEKLYELIHDESLRIQDSI